MEILLFESIQNYRLWPGGADIEPHRLLVEWEKFTPQKRGRRIFEGGGTKPGER